MPPPQSICLLCYAAVPCTCCTGLRVAAAELVLCALHKLAQGGDLSCTAIIKLAWPTLTGTSTAVLLWPLILFTCAAAWLAPLVKGFTGDADSPVDPSTAAPDAHQDALQAVPEPPTEPAPPAAQQPEQQQVMQTSPCHGTNQEEDSMLLDREMAPAGVLGWSCQAASCYASVYTIRVAHAQCSKHLSSAAFQAAER